jgi:DNA-binding MarR family transcriptional regulator
MDTPRPIGFWLKLVDRLIDEQFAATLEEHGITRRQWQLLNVLHAQPATIEQLDAAVAPFLAPEETSAEHLTELVESAWVESTAAGYTLTERGRAALDRLSQVVATQRTAIAEGVSAEQYQATVAVLERMAANLGFEG